MSLDKCKILAGKDIPINEEITLKQPTVGEVIDFGESRFFNTFYSFCSIPSDMKSFLWDLKIDFMKISDWELFINLTRNLSADDTRLIFNNIDFSSYDIGQISEDGKDEPKVILYHLNEDRKIDHIIDEDMYNSFIDYVREMIGYSLKREKAMNKVTKMAMIEEDRINRAHPKKNSDESFLFTAIVSLVNTEEFKYTYESVLDITIYQLMKSFYQIQNKKSACALYQGSMSGFVDTSKIDKKAFNWTYTNDKKL